MLLAIQNHLTQVQGFFLGMLSAAGRAHVSGVFRQRRQLYGPGVSPLKDAATNYAAFTGSHKALFACVQLIVFRGVLSSVAAMVRQGFSDRPLLLQVFSFAVVESLTCAPCTFWPPIYAHPATAGALFETYVISSDAEGCMGGLERRRHPQQVKGIHAGVLRTFLCRSGSGIYGW